MADAGRVQVRRGGWKFNHVIQWASSWSVGQSTVWSPGRVWMVGWGNGMVCWQLIDEATDTCPQLPVQAHKPPLDIPPWRALLPARASGVRRGAGWEKKGLENKTSSTPFYSSTPLPLQICCLQVASGESRSPVRRRVNYVDGSLQRAGNAIALRHWWQTRNLATHDAQDGGFAGPPPINPRQITVCLYVIAF